MRTLRYAILGLVDRKPTTGYDIAKEFKERELSNFWSARHSQIYPELAKLAEEDSIKQIIELSQEFGASRDATAQILMDRKDMTKEEALKRTELYWKDSIED